MLRVKTKCNSLFRKYEKCHKSYPNDANRCSDSFYAFLNCVEMVAGDAPNS